MLESLYILRLFPSNVINKLCQLLSNRSIPLTVDFEIAFSYPSPAANVIWPLVEFLVIQ